MKIENLKKVFAALFVGAVLCAVLRDFIFNINVILAILKFIGFIAAFLMVFFHKEIIEEIKKRASECKKECREIDDIAAAEKKIAVDNALEKVMHKNVPAFLTTEQEWELSKFITDICNIIGKYEIEKSGPVCKRRQELYHNIFIERKSVPFEVRAKDGQTFVVGARIYPLGFNHIACVCPEDIDMLEENYQRKPVLQEPVYKENRRRRNDKKIKQIRELRRVRKNATGIIINGKEYQRPDMDIAAKQWVLDNKKRILSFNSVTNNMRIERKMTPKELYLFIPQTIFPKDKEFRDVVFQKLKDMHVITRHRRVIGGYSILLNKSQYERVAKKSHEANASMNPESTEPLRNGYAIKDGGVMTFDART